MKAACDLALLLCLLLGQFLCVVATPFLLCLPSLAAQDIGYHLDELLIPEHLHGFNI